MARYVTQWNYGAKYGEGWLGPWGAGTEVDLSDEEAGFVNRDSPGCLTTPVASSEDRTEPVSADPVAVEVGAPSGEAAQGDAPAGPAEGDGNSEKEPEEVEAVPDGTAQVVLNWVGDDPEKAQRALDTERERDNPRSTLVAALERLAVGAFDRQHRGGFNRAVG